MNIIKRRSIKQLILPKALMFYTNQSFNSSASTIVNQASTIVNTSNKLTAKELNRFNKVESKKTLNVFSTKPMNQTATPYTISQYTSVNDNQVQAPLMNPNMTGKIIARKTYVYDGKTSIDDSVDSMKA